MGFLGAEMGFSGPGTYERLSPFLKIRTEEWRVPKEASAWHLSENLLRSEKDNKRDNRRREDRR